MNRRQRKKKKAQVFTIILGCTAFCKAEQYEKIRKSVEYQLRTGSVVMLPAILARRGNYKAARRQKY